MHFVNGASGSPLGYLIETIESMTYKKFGIAIDNNTQQSSQLCHAVPSTVIVDYGTNPAMIWDIALTAIHGQVIICGVVEVISSRFSESI